MAGQAGGGAGRGRGLTPRPGGVASHRDAAHFSGSTALLRTHCRPAHSLAPTAGPISGSDEGSCHGPVTYPRISGDGRLRVFGAGHPAFRGAGTMTMTGGLGRTTAPLSRYEGPPLPSPRGTGHPPAGGACRGHAQLPAGPQTRFRGTRDAAVPGNAERLGSGGRSVQRGPGDSRPLAAPGTTPMRTCGSCAWGLPSPWTPWSPWTQPCPSRPSWPASRCPRVRAWPPRRWRAGPP